MAQLALRDHYDDTVVVDDHFDRDGDLEIGGNYFSRAEIKRLRDHLTAVLGDGPKPGDDLAALAGAARGVVAHLHTTGGSRQVADAFEAFAREIDTRRHL